MKQLQIFTKYFAVSTALIVGLTALSTDTYGGKTKSGNTKENKGKEKEKEREAQEITANLITQDNSEDNKEEREENPLRQNTQELKIQHHTGSQKPIEPLPLFPEEVWLHIFSQENLSFPDKVRLKRVCRRTGEILNDPAIWPQNIRNLYKSLWGKEPWAIRWSKENIKFCKENYGQEPWELIEIPEKVVRVEASMLKLLVPNASMIWKLGIRRANDITLANLSSFSNLTELDVGFGGITDAALKTIAEACPTLISLDLKGCTHINGSGLQHISEHCKNLKKLNLKDCDHIQLKWIACLKSLGNNLQGLKLPNGEKFEEEEGIGKQVNWKKYEGDWRSFHGIGEENSMSDWEDSSASDSEESSADNSD